MHAGGQLNRIQRCVLNGYAGWSRVAQLGANWSLTVNNITYIIDRWSVFICMYVYCIVKLWEKKKLHSIAKALYDISGIIVIMSVDKIEGIDVTNQSY